MIVSASGRKDYERCKEDIDRIVIAGKGVWAKKDDSKRAGTSYSIFLLRVLYFCTGQEKSIGKNLSDNTEINKLGLYRVIFRIYFTCV
jgi:hypothetical protein